MMQFVSVKCIVEFMDGTERVYKPVGGATESPQITDSGCMNLIYKTGEYGDTKHLATIPLINVRQYWLEPL